MKVELLNLLQQLNSTEISDALDALGLNGYIDNLSPMSLGKRIIGPAYTVKYQPYGQKLDKFMPAGNYIDEVPSGHIVVIDNDCDTKCSVWGSILTTYSLHKGIAGTIINGMIRDKHHIQGSQYPIFSVGATSRSGKNRVKLSSVNEQLCIGDVYIKPLDIIFADESGVIVLPQNRVSEILQLALNIRINEDKIVNEIYHGSSLEDARNKFHYDCPWVEQKESI